MATTRNKQRESTFARTQRVLGTLVGGLSIFALITKSWESGIATPLELLVDTYNGLLNFFLGWAQPYLHALTETLAGWTGLDLLLYPHWKASMVAYGILVGAGLSAWGESKFPGAPQWLISILAGGAGVVVGLVDAMLQRDLQTGEPFYGLWQLIGQSYLLVLTFAFAVMLAAVGYTSLHATQPFMTRGDAQVCWTAGKRTLGIYAGAAAFALFGAGGKLLGI